MDTGADPTVLAPADAGRLEIPLAQLPSGPPSAGVGGTTLTLAHAGFEPLLNQAENLLRRFIAERHPLRVENQRRHVRCAVAEARVAGD